MRARDNRAATMWIPLVDVRVATGRVDAATVERYRRWLEQGREAPPVRLARHGDEFVVRDGRHRVAAALAAGHVLIEAELGRIGRLVIRLWRGWFGGGGDASLPNLSRG